MEEIHEVSLMLDSIKRISDEREYSDSNHEASSLNMNQLQYSFHDYINQNIDSYNKGTMDTEISFNPKNYNKLVSDYLENRISKEMFMNLILEKKG